MNPLCTYLGYLFLNYCSLERGDPIVIGKNSRAFSVEYQWEYVNFTWPNYRDYTDAVTSRRYIPENVAITGIKYYKGNIYVALPQIRKGVPIALGKISAKHSPKVNPLIEPYPSWNHRIKPKDCALLQSVQSMEIDKNGIMWVLDGYRKNRNTICPPKLVLLDLNNDGREILSYVFPKDVCSFSGGHLKDIVVEGQNEDHAYITDNSLVDPGLIVYSRRQNRAWKLRDRTMFDEEDAVPFVVGNLTVKTLAPISGIALAPGHSRTGDRAVFYSPLAGTSLYAVKTKVLKNQKLIGSGDWRKAVKIVGRKPSQSDGLVIDNRGNLYYTLPPLYAVGKWNINSEFSTAEIIAKHESMLWTGSFAFDDSGYLRLLTNNINVFMELAYPLKLNGEVMFKIFKYHTNTTSYQN